MAIFRTLDRGIGAACESYARAEAERRFNRLSAEADRLADQAAKLTKGSAEWVAAVKRYAAIAEEAENAGTPIIK